MRVTKPQKELRDGYIRFSVRITYESPIKAPVTELWYEFPEKLAPLLTSSSEPFVVALLMFTMKRGENIEVEEPLSPKLLDGLKKYQDIFCGWSPSLYRPIEIIAETRAEETIKKSPLTAAAFSGGADSFYTLWSHLSQSGNQPKLAVDYALFVHGFDIELSENEIFDSWVKKYDVMLEELGVTLLTGRTNVRELDLNWAHAHGTALIASAMFFAPHIGSFLIPSSRTPGKKAIVLGSDPRIDSLLSTDSIDIIHDDDIPTKFDKLKKMGDWEPMHRNLRVCWKNPHAEMNCSRCDKCAMTMTMLDVLGLLPKYKTFHPRSRHAYRMVKYDLPHQRRCGYEMLGYAHQMKRRDIMHDVAFALLRTKLFGKVERLADRIITFLKHQIKTYVRNKADNQ